MKLLIFSLTIFIFLSACAPYAKGPVFTTEKAKETFNPLINFMEIEPGMTIADVGAGSGVLTVIMATQLDSCTVYIQDIDQKVLQQKNVDKMLAHYSKKLGYDLGKRNEFKLVYGTYNQSKLPDNSIDIIYSNATIHVFDEPDAMLTDLRKKLKPNGKIYIRDGFKKDKHKEEFCTSRDCGKRLISVEELLAMMDKNGYQLFKQIPDMSGYPVYGFEIAN